MVPMIAVLCFVCARVSLLLSQYLAFVSPMDQFSSQQVQSTSAKLVNSEQTYTHTPEVLLQLKREQTSLQKTQIKYKNKTRSTGTVHTSVKASLTSVSIRIYGSGSVSGSVDPYRHQNLIVCSLANCQPSLKISRKSVRTFLRKVASGQTNRQTTTEVNITELGIKLCELKLFTQIWCDNVVIYYTQ